MLSIFDRLWLTSNTILPTSLAIYFSSYFWSILLTYVLGFILPLPYFLHFLSLFYSPMRSDFHHVDKDHHWIKVFWWICDDMPNENETLDTRERFKESSANPEQEEGRVGTSIFVFSSQKVKACWVKISSDVFATIYRIEFWILKKAAQGWD